jgi:hypothetical protein
MRDRESFTTGLSLFVVSIDKEIKPFTRDTVVQAH